MEPAISYILSERTLQSVLNKVVKKDDEDRKCRVVEGIRVVGERRLDIGGPFLHSALFSRADESFFRSLVPWDLILFRAEFQPRGRFFILFARF